MNQINIRIEREIDDLLTYIAGHRKKPKAIIVKELLMENLVERILPQLLLDYQAGKIGIKKILRLTGLSSDELLQRIVKDNIQCPITPEIDEYTENISRAIIQNEKEKTNK